MHQHHQHHHDSFLVGLSILIAIFASYTALDIANSVSRGKIRWAWLLGGSVAMGVGIWSMHFVGMLAFSLPGIDIFYDVPLLILSIVVAIIVSAFTLFLVSQSNASVKGYLLGSVTMGGAIVGMHYIGIASMRLAAKISWNYIYVILSIVIAVGASFAALFMAFRLKNDISLRGFIYRGIASVAMGLAIAGMHYTAMMAMDFTPSHETFSISEGLLATNGLAAAVIVGTLIILGIALVGSNIDRALSKKTLAADVLEDAIRVRDEFLSIASHELKTPLTSVKLQVQMLKLGLSRDVLEPARINRMLEQADKSVDRITRLVDDILDISRLSTGKLHLQLERFDLNDLLLDVIERLELLMKGAQCEVTYEKDGPVIGEWDKFRLEQVVTNLFTNAARYGKGKPVRVKLYRDQKFAYISVKDHGMGISLEDQDRIFQKFERATNSLEQRGLGLGLFITLELVKMHGGEVKVISAVHEGSEFIVGLPLET
jgi:NO-binding membrane sensor protein with MHYT domain/two-component sensor histidine kinase